MHHFTNGMYHQAVAASLAQSHFHIYYLPLLSFFFSRFIGIRHLENPSHNHVFCRSSSGAAQTIQRAFFAIQDGKFTTFFIICLLLAFSLQKVLNVKVEKSKRHIHTKSMIAIYCYQMHLYDYPK